MARLTEPESCVEHDDAHPSDLAWAYALEPSQIDGLFWCFGGKHYVRVTKEQLPAALYILETIGDMAVA